ncbi:MAG: RNA methyltransferase [Lachnospiraceae bacterium]|nr:RNA methyltransferase [Lachnospiraceae bacterium]
MITSISNAQVKQVCAYVQKAKERRKDRIFVVEGPKMFEEAPAERIYKVYATQSFCDKHTTDGMGAKLKETGFEVVSDEVLAKMSDTKTPQGILCLVKWPEYSLEDLLLRKKGVFVVLEDLQDPGNLGTIIRTGEGAGIAGVIMSGNTVDIFNPKTIRATMGSIYRVPFVYVQDMAQAIKRLKRADIAVYAAHLKGEQYYDAFDYTKGCAFLIGNEGNGLKEETALLADTYVKIPMAGQVESLNAAIATTLFMYEAARQRGF